MQGKHCNLPAVPYEEKYIWLKLNTDWENQNGPFGWHTNCIYSTISRAIFRQIKTEVK